MQIKTEPVQILEVDTWSEPGAEKPIQFKNGVLVEYVGVIDANGQPRKITISQDANGVRDQLLAAKEAQQAVVLDCTVVIKQEAVMGQFGPYVRNKDAWHVVSASVVK